MSFLNFFRRQKNTTSHPTALLKTGRIIEGTVIDVKTDDKGHITHVYYSYIVAGVEYESSQELDADQRDRQSNYAPGGRIVIRYDPRHPINSIVV
jgi:hypothetical protein